MTIFLNLTQARDNFPNLIKKISNGESVVVTKRGKIVALISALKEGELETDAILNNPGIMKKIRQAKKDIQSGKMHSYEEVFKGI